MPDPHRQRRRDETVITVGLQSCPQVHLSLPAIFPTKPDPTRNNPTHFPLPGALGTLNTSTLFVLVIYFI